MGTDAPEQMGFHVSFVNNVYINPEPDSREETKRLFTALSAGAYYGSCTDKYGVQWMLNCNAK